MQEDQGVAKNLEQRVVCRPITQADCDTISDIIGHYASQAILLWRTPEDIAKRIDGFLLAELDGRPIGCVAVQDYGNALMEVRSLAVVEEVWGKGVGSLLIKAAVKLAKAKGATRIFALTKRANLFVNNGFAVTKRSEFPQKVWNDCALCPKIDNCVETAVEYTGE